MPGRPGAGNPYPAGEQFVSLGAKRWALARRFGVESFVLAALGGAAGLLVAAWSIDLLRVLQPQGAWQGEASFVRGLDFRLVEIGLPTVIFTTALALASALVFVALPAWMGSRIAFGVARRTRETWCGGLCAKASHLARSVSRSACP